MTFFSHNTRQIDFTWYEVTQTLIEILQTGVPNFYDMGWDNKKKINKGRVFLLLFMD